MGKRVHDAQDSEPLSRASVDAATERSSKRRRGNGLHSGQKPLRHGKKQQEIVERTIEKYIKVVGKSLKLAKGFERQKLGKRLKVATSQHDGKVVDRLKAEIEAVKTLESRPELAQRHIYKCLLKTKSIRESPHLPDSVRMPERHECDDLTLNVIARLYNSNHVKLAMEAAVVEIRQVMGLREQAPADLRSKRTSASNMKSLAGRDAQSNMHHEEGVTLEYAPSEGSISPAAEDPGQLLELRGSGTAAASSVEASLEPGALFDLHRTDSDSISTDFDHPARISQGHKSKPRLPSEECYVSSRSSTPFSISETSEPPDLSVRSKRAVGSKTTHYLPALTTVGYISGSDSEVASDVESLVAPRRNRRGQRARQQIWEQKYGQKARHLHGSAVRDRDAGWDARYGAQETGKDKFGRDVTLNHRDGKSKSGKSGRLSTQANATGANEVLIGKPKGTGISKTKKQDDSKLHPSWEAKKLAKQRSQATAFTGKKISFD